MKIKSISIRNFFSIQDLHIDFDDSGILNIEGKNKDSNGSNGAGKSVVYEAIVWGLFGKTIRRSVQDSMVNNKIKKECEVIIKLDNIEIKRVIKPPYLHIKEGSKLTIKESVIETQKYIEQVLNTNYKAFLVANVFGQQNEIDFISASAEDKRTIVKTFLGLEDFFILRDKFKTKKNEVYNKLKVADMACDSAKASMEKLSAENTKINAEVQAIKDKYKVSELLPLSDILAKEKEKDRLQNLLHRLSADLQAIRADIAEYKDELAEDDYVDKCNSCGSVLGEKPIGWEKRVQKSLADAKTIETSLKTQIEDALAEFEAIIIPISSSEYKKIENVEKLIQKVEVNKELSVTYNSQFTENKTKSEKFNKYYEILKFWESVFSEQGVIKYVIHNILDHFNDRCLYYISILSGGKMTVSFNDSFEESIKINGQETYYTSLSGGERRKANFAILLALQSLLSFTSKSKFDFILLDEVVESIDDESVLNFYSLLSELGKTKLVFVISHNQTLKECMVNNPRIKLVKSKGVTKLAK